MNVLVSLEDRFFKTKNGNIYSNTTCDYKFWQRYLQVFDDVYVMARVCKLDKDTLKTIPANGPHIHFIELPYYLGLSGYLKTLNKLNSTIKYNLDQANVFILRIPGAISTILWRHLTRHKIPYGVEVLGDSFDSIKTAGAIKCLGHLLGIISARNQKHQCQNAAAAAYVSQYYLQRKYPPGCWSTHYSTLDLPEEAIISNDMLGLKEISYSDFLAGHRPLRICHAGTMEVAYKAQDILMEACHICISDNMPINLTLLGDGRLYKYYYNKACSLGIINNVKFLGALPAGEKVREQLDQADLFVLPSITEGLPRVLIEAMARGLPCIATNVGGIPELLDERFIVPPNNPTILASRIISLANNPDIMREISYRNLKVANNYRMHELNSRRIEFYNKLVSESSYKTNKHI